MQRRGGARRLAAVLFTDVVGSTEIANEVGDARWRSILARHNAIAREQLRRFGGRLEDTAGDGLFASFPNPADAISCAISLIDAIRAIGLEIRAGVHFGEVETVDGKLAGIGVHTGARVMSAAGAGEVFVSASTRDLVAGGGLTFSDHGEQRLKGLDEPVRLFSVEAVNGRSIGEPLDPDEARRRRDAVTPAGRGRRRWIAVAVVAALLVSGGVVVATRGGGDTASTSGRGPVLLGVDASTRQVDSVHPILSVEAPCGTFEPPLSVGADKLWLGEESLLVSIDPSTGDELTDTPIPAANGCSFGLTQDRGWHAWLLRAFTLVQIDPSTGKAVASRVLSPLASGIPQTSLALSDDAIWVGGNRHIAEVDPSSLDYVAHDVPFSVDAVAYGDGALYAIDQFEGWVYRLDPHDMAVEAKVQINVDIPELRVGEGSVWLLDLANGTVQRFAEDDLHPLGTFSTGAHPGGIAVGLGAVWVPDASGTLYRIDTTTGLTTPIAVGSALRSVAVDPERGSAGTIWLTADRAPTSADGS